MSDGHQPEVSQGGWECTSEIWRGIYVGWIELPLWRTQVFDESLPVPAVRKLFPET